jgi:hypothetical protein
MTSAVLILGNFRDTGKIRVKLNLNELAFDLAALLSLHTPVNDLHSIEIKAHTNLFFLLTQKIEGVKP